ncbi:MAG TPA: hypothetical protein VFQ77_17010 [Pseudonocardiaceae bacterium]|nr:hypothetical protein [Pseudonocardiaceae bacterium]
MGYVEVSSVRLTLPDGRRCSMMSVSGSVKQSFDRFLIFGADGQLRESSQPRWDETGVARPQS